MDYKEVSKLSPNGSAGIIHIYLNQGGNLRRIFLKGYIYPFLIALGLALAVWHKVEDFRTFLVSLNDQLLSLLPNLLGFNLGAYTLFVGFGGRELLLIISDYKDKNNRSLYQKNSAIFAFCIMIQFTTLLISYCLKIFLELKITAPTAEIARITNYSVIVILLFLSLTSLYVLKDLIVNIFNLSQKYHMLLFYEKLKNKATKEKEEKLNP